MKKPSAKRERTAGCTRASSCSRMLRWTVTLVATSIELATPSLAWTSSPSTTRSLFSSTRGRTTKLSYDSRVHYKPTESGWMPPSQLPKNTEEAFIHHPFDVCQQWQTDFFHSNIRNLRPLSVSSRKGTEMSVRSSADASLYTQLWSSDDYRLIRMTNFTSSNTHVISSMLYPRSSLLPVLGMELIQIGPQLHICAADFQPVDRTDTSDAPAMAASFEAQLSSIRNDYPSLQGHLRDNAMSVMFSEHLLLGKCREKTSTTAVHNLVQSSFLPALQRYQHVHTKAVESASALCPVVDDNAVLEHHAKFDALAASVDKSKHMLSKAFGEDWAHEYIHDIMFPLAGQHNER